MKCLFRKIGTGGLAIRHAGGNKSLLFMNIINILNVFIQFLQLIKLLVIFYMLLYLPIAAVWSLRCAITTALCLILIANLYLFWTHCGFIVYHTCSWAQFSVSLNNIAFNTRFILSCKLFCCEEVARADWGILRTRCLLWWIDWSDYIF